MFEYYVNGKTMFNIVNYCCRMNSAFITTDGRPVLSHFGVLLHLRLLVSKVHSWTLLDINLICCQIVVDSLLWLQKIDLSTFQSHSNHIDLVANLLPHFIMTRLCVVYLQTYAKMFVNLVYQIAVTILKRTSI